MEQSDITVITTAENVTMGKAELLYI